MNERVVPGPVQDSCGIREAVCIHTKKIYDSCRDKDCIEDLRVYPTRSSQAVIDRALSVRGGRAELLQAYIDVEPASYNRGFFSVDIRYYYRITAEAFVGGSRPAEISGLAVFDKRVLLFGSEGNAKIFTSRYRPEEPDCQGLGRRSRASHRGKPRHPAAPGHRHPGSNRRCSNAVLHQPGPLSPSLPRQQKTG